MLPKIELRPETAEKYEIVDYTGADEVYVIGHGNICFSKLTPSACAALLSRKFPYLKEKAIPATTTVPKTEKSLKPE